MFRVFPSRASSAAVYEALLDGILGFVALLAAAATLDVVPGGLAAVVSDSRAVAMALGFACVMALLQSFVGVYRHRLALVPLTLRISVVVVLEFSRVAEPLRKPYDWYSFQVLPRLGQWVAGDGDSYRYLAESIRMHPDQQTLAAMMGSAGLERVEVFNLAAGVVAVHRGFRI